MVEQHDCATKGMQTSNINVYYDYIKMKIEIYIAICIYIYIYIYIYIMSVHENIGSVSIWENMNNSYHGFQPNTRVMLSIDRVLAEEG